MALTDTFCRNVKHNGSATGQKCSDGGGLYLHVTASGKYWRMAYRMHGKQKTLAFGVYPIVTLAEARGKRDAAKKQLAQGTDPGHVRRVAKLEAAHIAGDSFEAVAREWIAKYLSTKAPGHRDKIVRRLERDAFPYVGSLPVVDVSAPAILALARRVEGRGTLETAHRLIQNVGQVIRYAVATGRAKLDPTPSLRGALPPVDTKHFAAPTDDPDAVGAILRMFEAATGTPQVIAAVKLLPLLVCRPGELRAMKWSEVDLEAAKWRYRVSKTGIDHIIALSTQALAILKDLQPYTLSMGDWVFPGARSAKNTMSDAAINAAYRRLGIDTKNELTGHGWRALLRTFGHERLGLKPEVIETHIAHKPPDTSGLGNAYARMKFMDERRLMMQAWADYLDKLRSGGKVMRYKKA